MNEIKLLAVGDISLQTRNELNPFHMVEKVFKDKNILFGNLETPLSNQEVKTKKAVALCSSPDKVKYLKNVGFDVLNITNNHILDCGVEGFNDTITTLGKNRLNFIGANNNQSASNHLVLEKNNVKFGFLGYTTGHFNVPENISINKLDKKKIFTDIRYIQNKCDFIIVSLHWGIENVMYPSPKQISLAHQLIDEGVTLILGHHPHVIQGIEEYRNGLIAYSLGNFQFSPLLSKSKTNSSIIFCVEFNKDGIKKYDIIPVEIDNNFLPKIIKGKEKNVKLKFISDISHVISSNKITNKWWFEEIAREYLSNNMNSYIIRIKKYGIMPLIKCTLWLITPFCFRCYAGIIRRKLKCSKRRET